MHSPESHIFVGGERRRLFGSSEAGGSTGAAARGDSSQGVPQGSAESSAMFCTGIHPEVQQLDTELRALGGGAWFDMDDGYAVGAAADVFPAIGRFAERVWEQLCLTVACHKLAWYSPAVPL
eukprot:6214785-Pleurochrysis_carterae.AAC.2